MYNVIMFVSHLGPNPIGNWICFIMLMIAVLTAITQSSHLAMTQLLTVFIGIVVGWSMGF